MTVSGDGASEKVTNCLKAESITQCLIISAIYKSATLFCQT